MQFSPLDFQDAIDTRAIYNLKNIDPSIDVKSKIETNCAVIGMLLKNALYQLLQRNFDNLESICLELSHGTLQVGASELLKSSFELQAYARQRNYKDSLMLIKKMIVVYNKLRNNLPTYLEQAV